MDGCRLTLLLGPPGCGKTTFLLALAGKLDKSLKVSKLKLYVARPLPELNEVYNSNSMMPFQISGEISYNGYKLEEFVPQKTSAYISQRDQHIPEMTVRETIDFSARCQGVGSRSGDFSQFLLQSNYRGDFTT